MEELFEKFIDKEEIEYLKESAEYLRQLDTESDGRITNEQLKTIFTNAVVDNFGNPDWKEILVEEYKRVAEA